MKSNFPIGIPLLAFALFTFSGCASLIKTYSEEEPGVNLSQYYTYDWLKNNETPPGEPAQYPLSRHADGQIRNATDAQMQYYGYQRGEVEPDLLLHYHVVVANRVYLQHDWNCGYSETTQNSACHHVQPVYFREGTLIIDFMDTRTGRQVWRGVAVGTVENYAPAQWDAEIAHTIRQIFKKFPLKPRSPAEVRAVARK